MTRRRIMPGLGLITLITSLAAVFALAVPALAQSAPGAKTWKVPRTADGHADLEGVWNNNTATPFERPSASADKAVFLPSEVAALEKQEARRFADRPPQPGSPAGFNEFWFDPPPKVLANGRNSLVIDPPDGGYRPSRKPRRHTCRSARPTRASIPLMARRTARYLTAAFT